jgi:hypothetical protein
MDDTDEESRNDSHEKVNYEFKQLDFLNHKLKRDKTKFFISVRKE